MFITRVAAELLRVPLPRPRALPRADEPASRTPPDSLDVLLVRLESNAEISGLGVAYVPRAGRSLLAAVEDGLAPGLTGSDPRFRQRLFSALPPDVPAAARAAVDIGLWDLAAKAAGLPLWQFLGGARDSVPAYAAETARPGMNADQVLAVYEPLRAKGVTGLQVAVGSSSPEADARTLEEIRNHIGLDDWLGVTANGALDVGTALAMGRFLEEEMDADWFEDPVSADDRRGLRWLADRLEVPVAAGGRFGRVADFAAWVADAPSGVIRPDVLRLGGLTPAVQAIQVASALGRPAVPVLMPEVGVHLACGLAGVRAVDYVGWLEALWKTPPAITGGRLLPPPGPGLGIEPNPDALARFRVRP